MNQTQNGGQWNLLGTFTLDPSLNPKVELSDQANGTVVADAVMVVPNGTASDRVTYTPTLSSAGTFDIYAKWSESHTRAEIVTYTIHHGGGSTDMVVNQQQPSAGWFRLGAFTMSPGQNHRVEVEGALEGETVADAMRFVSAGTSAPGIHYVHADHLGSPQKMTDANQALVWDAVFTPFGQVNSITGTATNNQRFPGQYFDQETGYHQNWFRDYDPNTGRYLQSDPLPRPWEEPSLYIYSKNNPFGYFDFRGKAPTKSTGTSTNNPQPEDLGKSSNSGNQNERKSGTLQRPKGDEELPKKRPRAVGACGTFFRGWIKLCDKCPYAPLKGVCIAGCTAGYLACIAGSGFDFGD